jgi:hypothetical protein
MYINISSTLISGKVWYFQQIFSEHFKQTCSHSVNQVKKTSIPEARQFFFQINTVIEFKTILTTVVNDPIRTIQKPADWPEKRLQEGAVEVY